MQDQQDETIKTRPVNYPFLQGGGEMGMLTRNLDWKNHPLGKPDQWPQSLKTTLSIILNSKFPMFLFWGTELFCFYNDAYRPSLGNKGKHPYALGKRGVEVWPEIWDFIKPLIDKVLGGGEAAWYEDQLLPIYRNEQMEDVYWTFSYSPVNDESGKPAGVFVTCSETTGKINNLKKLEESKDELAFAIDATELGTWDLNPVTNQFKANARLKEWFGLLPEDDIELHAALEAITEHDRPAVVKAIQRALMYESGGAYDIEYSITHPLTKKVRIVKAKGKVWFDEKKAPYRFNGTLQDITSEKKVKEALTESENRFRSIVEQAPVATSLFVGKEMTIEIANDIMIGYWGKGKGVIGKPLMEALPELEGQPFPGLLATIFETGVTHQAKDSRAELVVDGVRGVYYFDFTYKPLFDTNGKVYAIMNMAIDVTERYIATKKIEEVQDQLLASFEQSPAAIAIISEHDLKFTMANPFYGQLVGRDPSFLLDKPLLEALPELKGQGFDDLLRNVIKTGIPYKANEVGVDIFRNNKMEKIYVDLVYQPKLETDRRISGVLVVATDVTQQVISRRKVEASEQRFRALIEEAPIPTCLFVGRNMIIELANDAMLLTWGKGNAVLGKPHSEVMPELKTQQYLQILENVYDTGKAYEARAARVDVNKAGNLERHYFNFTYKPLFDTEQQVYAIMAMAVDVTEEVVGRKKIEEAETSLRGAIELAALSTWSLDLNKNTISYSPRFMDWLGFTEDTKDLDEAYNPLPGHYRESVPAAIAAAIAGNGLYENEHPIVNRTTGQVRIIHAQAQLIYDENGQAISLSGTAQDITEQRRIREQLEQQVAERTIELEAKAAEIVEANKALQKTNAELNEFAYIASHDLQEPLRKVMVFTDMMESSLETIPDKTRTYIDKINTSTARMQTLINDVLKFSLLSQEREKFEEVDLNDIINNVLSDYELLIGQKGATVTVERLPVVEAIPLQMSQLFTNLVSNALKFSAAERPLHIQMASHTVPEGELAHYPELEKGHDYIKLTFTDNGIGFNQENASQIFTIFQRLHSKSEYEGTGIGLALCKKIVNNHHGIIYANSKKNEGSVFSIILPLSQFQRH